MYSVLFSEEIQASLVHAVLFMQLIHSFCNLDGLHSLVQLMQCISCIQLMQFRQFRQFSSDHYSTCMILHQDMQGEQVRESEFGLFLQFRQFR